MSIGCQIHLHHDHIDGRQQVSTKLDGNRDIQDEQHNGRYTPLSFPLHQHACPSRLISVGYVAHGSCEPLFSSDPQKMWLKAMALIGRGRPASYLAQPHWSPHCATSVTSARAHYISLRYTF